MKERLAHIDIAKGIAIILVVYGHGIHQMKEGILYDQYLLVQSQVIFSFVMPLFFMISAALQRRSIESTNFLASKYIKKYTTSILIPFFVLSIIFLFLNLILIPDRSPSIPDMVISLLVMQSSSEMLPSGILWFLYTLFVFSVITSLISTTNKNSALFVVILAVILKLLSPLLTGNYILGIDKLSNFYIYFAIGHNLHKNIIINSTSNIIIFLSLISGYVILFLYQKNNHHSFGTEIFNLFGFVGFMGTFVMLDVGRFIGKFSKTIIIPLTYIGQNSILIYVFHMPTFTIMKKISSIIAVAPNSYLFLIFLVVPGVFFPLLYGKIISHNQLAYKLLLGRTPSNSSVKTLTT